MSSRISFGPLTRRDFLRRSALLAGSVTLSGCVLPRSSPRGEVDRWPRYIISREQDEIFLSLTAIGYEERSVLGCRSLHRLENFPDPLLVFDLGPQGYSESAVVIEKVIPTVIPETILEGIKVLPSASSVIVFRPSVDTIKLEIEVLLNWKGFELVLPDLDTIAPPYTLEVERDPARPMTRIELPWGVELTPLGTYGVAGDPPPAGDDATRHFIWQHSIEPKVLGDSTEIWTTALVNPYGLAAVNYEILSVRGFRLKSISGKVEDGTLVATYDDRPGVVFPEEGLTKPWAATLRNLDRINLASSLSRRFPYTGDALKNTESGLLQYVSPAFNSKSVCLNACGRPERDIPVKQLRLSSRGGWLELDSEWVPDPGCGLKGWTHSSAAGSVNKEKLITAGFLFPFGTPAELVVISERAFIKNDVGHYIAVLIKQAFIEVPQPNSIPFDHLETPFRSISVTTKATPPLDCPPTSPDCDPAEYQDYDYFVPTVDGAPFLFEHVGRDWANREISSRMPLVFVNNKARLSNGLIWEPDLPEPSNKLVRCGPTPNPAQPVPKHFIPKVAPGLRVVDQFWNEHPYRFAQYGDESMALADPLRDGDTSQRVQWVEWCRGPVPKLNANGIADRPFRGRARTMKLRFEGIGQFSGQRTWALATYRDTRFVSVPILDPEPSAPHDLYNLNIPAEPPDPENPYIHILETRNLVAENQKVPDDPSDDVRARRIRDLYYGTSTAKIAPPLDLFASVANEVQFGMGGSSSESTGGLAVPDTHVSRLSRGFGAHGDASFDPRRWPGYAAAKSKLETAGRLDYPQFRKNVRAPIDLEPFDPSRTQQYIDGLRQQARTVMGYTRPFMVAAAPGAQPLGLNLGELFGVDAQILPGINFKDIFQRVAVRELGSARSSAADDEAAAEPLKWQVRITGLEWITSLIGSAPGQITMAQLLEFAQNEGQKLELSEPVPFGVEASLSWKNDAFYEEVLGPIKFQPHPDGKRTAFALDAQARIDLGLDGLPLDLSALQMPPTGAKVSASAQLSDFVIVVFDAIEVQFAKVEFQVSPDGKKEFKPEIADVRLVGVLAFLNDLSAILKSLGVDAGIDIQISFARIEIGQSLSFPPAGDDTGFFIGPARVTNLALSWKMMIPLQGRDVLSLAFGVSSREKPLTIFVPPWYGGKAYVLMEVTSRGMRLLEISMEYGALIPITWGIAKGEASLMAGIFYSLERNGDSGKVIFRAFVKAAANLDVAGIINFCGLIFIGLSYEEDNGRRLVRGQALVSVSIKIGFVRVTYGFSAEHVEEAGGNAKQLASPGPFDAFSALGADPFKSTMPEGATDEADLFGDRLDDEQWRAFERVVRGYRCDEAQAA